MTFSISDTVMLYKIRARDKKVIAVELADLDRSARIILRFNNLKLSVVGDISNDIKMHVVTSSVSGSVYSVLWRHS